MARYADYVKDDLTDEIQEASENQEERKSAAPSGFEMPDRFKGKSAEEIAQSFVELEKLNSKQANDLGVMRKNVDELIALQLRETEEPPADEPAVDMDSLYEDTEGSISRVAEKAVDGRIKALEDQLEKKNVEEAVSTFETKHGDWREVAATEDFAKWVGESAYRTRLAQAADAYDLDAANDLFDMYKDHTGQAKAVEDAARRERQLADASLETSSPGTIDTDEGFSRSVLTEARIAAKKGDRNAREYLAVNADAIALAYEEGRITD